MHFPNLVDGNGQVINAGSEGANGDGSRKRRESHYYSDEMTDEDFQIFKSYIGSKSQRYKRSVINKPKFTKGNATLYCMEKVSNTEIGRLCATLGANVQAKVNSCSIDLEVFLLLF